jgi:soluble P-type ATPase
MEAESVRLERKSTLTYSIAFKKIGERSMISVELPGHGDLRLENLVLDYNGTIAKDGILIEGIAERLREIAQCLKIYCITADTFGSAAKQLKGLPVEIALIKQGDERREKLDFVKKLGLESSVAIGNGANDEWMLREAKLGICVIGGEGCSHKALSNADVLVSDINAALELFLYPNRLKATLRF